MDSPARSTTEHTEDSSALASQKSELQQQGFSFSSAFSTPTRSSKGSFYSAPIQTESTDNHEESESPVSNIESIAMYTWKEMMVSSAVSASSTPSRTTKDPVDVSGFSSTDLPTPTRNPPSCSSSISSASQHCGAGLTLALSSVTGKDSDEEEGEQAMVQSKKQQQQLEDDGTARSKLTVGSTVSPDRSLSSTGASRQDSKPSPNRSVVSVVSSTTASSQPTAPVDSSNKITPKISNQKTISWPPASPKEAATKMTSAAFGAATQFTQLAQAKLREYVSSPDRTTSESVTKTKPSVDDEEDDDDESSEDDDNDEDDDGEEINLSELVDEIRDRSVEEKKEDQPRENEVSFESEYLSHMEDNETLQQSYLEIEKSFESEVSSPPRFANQSVDSDTLSKPIPMKITRSAEQILQVDTTEDEIAHYNLPPGAAGEDNAEGFDEHHTSSTETYRDPPTDIEEQEVAYQEQSPERSQHQQKEGPLQPQPHLIHPSPVKLPPRAPVQINPDRMTPMSRLGRASPARAPSPALARRSPSPNTVRAQSVPRSGRTTPLDDAFQRSQSQPRPSRMEDDDNVTKPMQPPRAVTPIMRIRYGEIDTDEENKASSEPTPVVSPPMSPTTETTEDLEETEHSIEEQKRTKQEHEKKETERSRDKGHGSPAGRKSKKKEKRRKRDASCNSSRASSSRATRTFFDDETAEVNNVSCHEGLRLMVTRIIQTRCGGLDDSISIYDSSSEESEDDSMETDDAETEYDESVREPKNRHHTTRGGKRIVSFDDESETDEERIHRFQRLKDKQNGRQPEPEKQKAQRRETEKAQPFRRESEEAQLFRRETKEAQQFRRETEEAQSFRREQDMSLASPVELKRSPPRNNVKRPDDVSLESSPKAFAHRRQSLSPTPEEEPLKPRLAVRTASPARNDFPPATRKNPDVDMRHLDRRQTQTNNASQRMKPYSFLENVDLHDRNFIKAFVAALTSTGIPLLMHNQCFRRKQAFAPGTLVTAYLRLGSEDSLGCFSEPRLVWETEDKAPKNAVTLFDIRGLDKASPSDLQAYPLAMVGRSVTLHTFSGGSFVFEAPNEDIALRFVHGMRWVVARLAFNLIIGNVTVSCELLTGEGVSQMTQKDRKEHSQINAMNDVTNHLVEKTYDIASN